MIALTFLPDLLVFQQQNALDYEVKGIEFTLNQNWSSGSIKGGYTWHAHGGKHEFFSPKHIAKLNLENRFLENRLSLALNWQFTGKRLTRSNENLGSFHMGRFYAYWQWHERSRLALNINNLLDRAYSQPVTVGSAQEALPQDGPSLALTFEIEF